MTAIYARQSLEGKDSLSIENQIDLCRRVAEGEATVYQDRGFSGKNTNRPAFRQLMEAVERGEVDRILVYRLDRFSRSIADFSQLWTVLERYHVQFQSVTENFDTASPMGRAMLNIVMTFAQLERETTAERVRDNYRHRVQLGAWPGGPAPFGYDLTRGTDAQGRTISTLAENEKARVVREAFRRYLDYGVSLRSLARELTGRGVQAPKREVWDNVTLSRIFRNPCYVQADEDVYWYYLAQGVSIRQPREVFDGVHGCVLIGKRDRGKEKRNPVELQQLAVGSHQGLVPSGLWLQVQEKLSGNRQLDRRQAGKYTWLTGLMKCGKCGYALRVNLDRRSGKTYLLCSGRSNYGVCDATIALNLRELEDGVEEALREMLDRCPAEELYPMEDGRTQELEEVEKKISRLVMALAESSEISVGYISQEIERLHIKKQELEERLKKKRAPDSRARRIDFREAGFEEKKVVAGEFIQRISIVGEEVNIEWKV